MFEHIRSDVGLVDNAAVTATATSTGWRYYSALMKASVPKLFLEICQVK